MNIESFITFLNNNPYACRIVLAGDYLAADDAFGEGILSRMLCEIKAFFNVSYKRQLKRENRAVIWKLIHCVREAHGDEAAQDIHMFVLKMPYLKGERLSADLVRFVLDYLEENKATYLIPNRETMKGITELDLSGVGMSNKALLTLLMGRDVRHLITLNLSNNGLGNESSRIIANAANLGRLKSLTDFDLSKNKIGDIGAIYLADSGLFSELKSKSRGRLNMMGNQFEEQGEEALSESGINVLGVKRFKENKAA